MYSIIIIMAVYIYRIYIQYECNTVCDAEYNYNNTVYVHKIIYESARK
jgi:hypothetical protein